MLVEDVSEWLLPVTPYLVLLLVLAAVHAFRRSGSRLHPARWILAAASLWSVALSTPAVANALIDRMERACPAATGSPDGREPLVLVLSSGSAPKRGTGYEVRLDAAGWERTWAGIRLWRLRGGQILFVGGPTPDGRSSAAEYMAEVARAAGVPPGAVRVETRSRDTYENLLFSRERLQGRAVWLVTSALHMRRAVAVARKLGLGVLPAPCDYRAVSLAHWYAWLPSSRGPEMFVGVLHELIGCAYYKWKGYAS